MSGGTFYFTAEDGSDPIEVRLSPFVVRVFHKLWRRFR